MNYDPKPDYDLGWRAGYSDHNNKPAIISPGGVTNYIQGDILRGVIWAGLIELQQAIQATKRPHVHDFKKWDSGTIGFAVNGSRRLLLCQCGAWKEEVTTYPPMGTAEWLEPTTTITKKSDNA